MTSLKFLSFFFTCIYFITRSRLFSVPRIFPPAPLCAVCLLMENAVQRFLEKKFFFFSQARREGGGGGGVFCRVARCYGTGEKPTGIYKGFYTGWPGTRKYHELFSRKLLEIPRFFSLFFFSFNSSTVKIAGSILLISTELFVIYSHFFFLIFK